MLTKKEAEPEMLGMKRGLIERPTEGCPHCRLGPVKKNHAIVKKKLEIVPYGTLCLLDPGSM